MPLVPAGIISGLAGAGAFAPVSQPWLAWIVPVPLILAFHYRRPVGYQAAAATGGVAGLCFYGTCLLWLTEVTVPGWIALVLFCTFFFMAWSLVLARLVRDLPETLTARASLVAAGLSSCAFTGLEWVRGWIFTGFPWNSLGVSQIELPAIAQIAEWGGVPLVTALVVFGGSASAMTVLRIIQESQQRGAARSLRPHGEFLLAVALAGGALYFGVGRLMERPQVLGRIHVLAVQPDIPQKPWGSGMEPGPALQRCIELTDSATEGGGPVDLLIWPETPIPESLDEMPEFSAFQKRVVPRQAAAFLYGSILRRGFEVTNSAVLIQQDEPFYQVYDKMHLVVMGEYVPFARALPFLRRWVPLGTDFTPGSRPVIFGAALQWRLAPLICFEDILPRVVRRFLPGAPHVFVNLTNDGWFGKSSQSWQHLQHARFRCIEFRRPMIRVANNGVTCWIDERGVVRELLRDPGTGSVQIPGTLRTVVPVVEARDTLYARWGDWPGWLGLWIVVAAGVRAWIRSPLKRRRNTSAVGSGAHHR